MEEKYGTRPIFTTDIQRMMMESALAREDGETAEAYMRDAIADAKKPQVRISKFSPGEHYYVFREKFDSLEEAQAHARCLGYRVLPGVEVTSMDDVLAAAIRARKGGNQPPEGS